MKELANYLLKSLALNKDAVVIEAKEEDNNVYLTVRVDESDKGRIIGKDGCIIKAYS